MCQNFDQNNTNKDRFVQQTFIHNRIWLWNWCYLKRLEKFCVFTNESYQNKATKQSEKKVRGTLFKPTMYRKRNECKYDIQLWQRKSTKTIQYCIPLITKECLDKYQKSQYCLK